MPTPIAYLWAHRALNRKVAESLRVKAGVGDDIQSVLQVLPMTYSFKTSISQTTEFFANNSLAKELINDPLINVSIVGFSCNRGS